MNWIDMHCDTLSMLLDEKNAGLDRNSLCVDIERLKESGAAAQFFACYVNAAQFSGYKDPWDRAYEMVLAMISYARRSENAGFGIACSCGDILRMERENRIAGILTVEEGGVLNGCHERLAALYDCGIRLVTLTWNHENCIGSPNSRERNVMEKGLTPFGIETVERMNELGMVVDVSHLSDGGFWDCIRHSRKPVAASHSNARALCPHPRNLTDEMLHALGENGGAAGVNFYGAFLRQTGGGGSQKDGKEVLPAGIKDIVRHIRYMTDRAGEDAVALGTDFDGFDRKALPAGIEGVQDMDLLWDEMKRAGFTERQIEKTAYGNVMRILHECIGRAERNFWCRSPWHGMMYGNEALQKNCLKEER